MFENSPIVSICESSFQAQYKPSPKGKVNGTLSYLGTVRGTNKWVSAYKTKVTVEKSIRIVLKPSLSKLMNFIYLMLTEDLFVVLEIITN